MEREPATRHPVWRERTQHGLWLVAATFLAVGLVASCSQDKQPEYAGPYGKQVAEAVPKIEAAVGLKFKTPPRVEARSKEQVRQYLVTQVTDPQAAKDIDGKTIAYKRLGMIPDSLDMKKFMIDLLTEQIIGYYDPHTKVLYIVNGSPKEAVAITVTHELVHALQDQYINLDSTQKLVGDNDRQSAAQAVFEGQAVYEQIVVMLGGGNVAVNLPGGWDRVRDMIRENQSSMPIFAAAPVVIQETLIFPYLSGAEFVRNYKERNPSKPIYNDMPVSTAQILHPSACFTHRDNPTTVTLPPLKGATGGYENDLGEFETRLFLFQNLNDQNSAVQGAAGWAGDRYEIIDNGQGIAWVTVWDSRTDASEYFDLLDKVMKKRYNATSTAPPGSTERNYSGAGRSVRISTTEVDGRPGVLYVDVPAASSTDVLDLTKVGLRQ